MKKLLNKITVLFLCAVFCITSSCFTTTAQAESFNKTKAKKNITVSYKKVSNGILAVYKNKNSYAVKLTAKMRFLDAADNDISVIKEVNNCLGAKSTAAIFYPAPYDSKGNIINYSSYKGSFSVAKTDYKSYSKKLTVSSDIQTISTNFSVVNTSDKNLKNIHVTVVFYDNDGAILGCQGKYLNCYEKGSSEMFTVSHDIKWITPAKVKVYVDWAYK